MTTTVHYVVQNIKIVILHASALVFLFSIVLCNFAAVFPNICSLSLAAFSSVKEWELKIKYWENVYGKTESIYE